RNCLRRALGPWWRAILSSRLFKRSKIRGRQARSSGKRAHHETSDSLFSGGLATSVGLQSQLRGAAEESFPSTSTCARFTNKADDPLQDMLVSQETAVA